jgi:hypothetical protein
VAARSITSRRSAALRRRRVCFWLDNLTLPR